MSDFVINMIHCSGSSLQQWKGHPLAAENNATDASVESVSKNCP
jgi:hypothetical protein